MSDGKTEQEPPMEEMLASIRRIISENAEADDPAKHNPPTDNPAKDNPAKDNPAKKKAGDEPGDVLDLTQMIKEDGSMVDLTKEEPESGSEPEPGSEPETEPPATAPASKPAAENERLVSAEAVEAATKPLADLARAAEPETAAPKGPTFRDTGSTVEDLMMELMRPMLREWLDDNLPQLVERLVQKEIRYLVRRSEPD